MSTTQVIKRWVPVVLWASVIFFLSSLPTLLSVDTDISDYFFKKIAHMFVYSVLYWLSVRAVMVKNNNNLIILVGLCIIYAISDEIHQSFVPGRTPKITDVGFDTIGILTVYFKQKDLI